MKLLAKWLKRCVEICQHRQELYGRKLKQWSQNIQQDPQILQIKKEVIYYCQNLDFYN